MPRDPGSDDTLASDAVDVGSAATVASTPPKTASVGTDATIASTPPGSDPGFDGTAVAPSRSPTKTVRDYDQLAPVSADHYTGHTALSQGGMGRIVVARDRRLGRRVAIKELLTQSPALRSRFEREALLTARLEHPSIVSVHEAGHWASGEPFYTMRLVPGRSFDKVIAEAVTLPARLALLPHVLAIADALAYAHKQRVIHRDLKPQNVMVGEFGETVVIDWGLAKDLADSRPDENIYAGVMRTGGSSEETEVGQVLGTPAYMPPEQAAGLPAGEPADVYAIGAILYHVLAGQPPYVGKTSHEILEAVKERPPASLDSRQPGIPPDLLAIVGRAMARAPADRYATARELADDLRRFQAGQLVGAHSYSLRQLLGRWLRRHRTTVTVGASAVLVLVVVSILGIRQIVHERRQAQDERAHALALKGEAEDLMDFMLFDLADKLRPIGKSKLLEAVAKKARDYYQARPELGSVDDQRRRAVALLNLGNVLLDQGDTAGARVQLGASLAIADRLVAADPQSVDLQRTKAAAHEAIGETIRTGGDARNALAEYRTAHEIRQRLAAGAPADTRMQIELANSHSKLARVMTSLGDEAALAEYRTSLAIRERLVAQAPADADMRRGLAISHDQIGEVLRTRGETAAALVDFREALTIREALAALAPDDVRSQIDIAMSHERVGNVLRAQADLAGALEHYRSSRAIRQRLAAQDPDNAGWQSELAIIEELVGNILVSQHDLPGALSEYEASLAIHKQLVTKDPSSTRWPSELQVAYIHIGNVLASEGKQTDSLAAFREAERICADLVARDPDNADWQQALTVAQEMVGDGLLALKDPAGALAEYRKTLVTREKLTAKAPTNAQWQRTLSVTHYKLGEVLKATHDLRAALIEYTAASAIMDRLAAQDRNNKQWQDEAAELRGTLATCCTPTPHK